MLTIWYQYATPKTRATVPTAVAAVIVSLFCQYLSHLEHLRSLRPSTTLCLFNGFALLFDLPRLRTLSFLPHNRTITIIFATTSSIKAGVLALESIEKRFLLKKQFSGCAPEDTAGIFNRTLFLWVNGLLWKGSKSTLKLDDLPVLDNDIRQASHPDTLLDRWNKSGISALLKKYERI